MARLGLQRQTEADITLKFGSNLRAISEGSLSLAINTASGPYKVIITLTLAELNRSISDATMPTGSVGSE